MQGLHFPLNPNAQLESLMERVGQLEVEVQRLSGLLSLYLDAHTQSQQGQLHHEGRILPTTAKPLTAALSPRELQVLRLFALAMPCKRIARHLGTEPQTVRNQLASIRKKLGAESKEHLLAIALTQTWLVDS